MSGLYRGFTGLSGGASGLALGASGLWNGAAGLEDGSGDPSLALDFTTALDSRVTFTRASTATYFDSAGVMQSAAIDIPRFDYNPATLAALGTRFEETRTNLLERASDISQADWVKIGSPTIGSNTLAAPDGATTGDLLTRTVATGTWVTNPVTKAASAIQYALTTFHKKSVGNYTTLRQQGGGGQFAEARFNNNDGTISTAAYTSGTFAGASASVQAINSGWQRNSIVATTDAITTVNAYSSVNSNNVATDGTDSVSNSAAGYWGAQLEAGAFSTSLIPTGAAAATRSPDDATMTGTNFSAWYNPAGNTIVVEATSPASGTRVVWEANDGTANNRVTIWTDGTTAKATIVAGGVSQAVLSLGAITANTAFKIALAFTTNDVAGSLGGAAEVTDTSVTLPTVDRCRWGSDTAGNYLCGCIKTATVYPYRRTDVQALAA